MRPHENLEVWKKSIDLVVKIYDTLKSFPSDEKFGLTSQIRRASVSVPSNIAEGAARDTDKDFYRFVSDRSGLLQRSRDRAFDLSQVRFFVRD